MIRFVTSTVAATVLAGAAFAQPVGSAPLSPADPRAEQPLPGLPIPPVDANAPPSAFLRAAQSAMLVGRNGEAREALERAQTRLLDRSVPLFQTNNPSEIPAVREISLALQALSGGDREASLRHIQIAMQTADETAR